MAPREVILHVGMHKTGTTSIQRTLDGFDDGRIAFADFKMRRNRSPNHGVALETIFREDFENVSHHKMLGRSRSTIARFRAQFAKRLEAQLSLDRDTLIFSGEAIPRLKPAELQALQKKLQSVTANIRVIAYLRDPVGFSSSMYQQRIKSGWTSDLRQVSKPRYKHKFAKFRKLFGADAVTFVNFDPASFPGGSVVKHFADFVGIPDLPESQLANTSLSADAARCLFVLADQTDIDLSGQSARVAFRDLGKLLGAGMTGPSFRLPVGAVAAVVPPADVDWVNTVSGFNFAVPEEKMTEEELVRDLSEISNMGKEQLRQILQAHGLAVVEGQDVPAMLCALYGTILASAKRKVSSGRLKDTLAAWLTR